MNTRLRAVREHLKLSRREFAERIGLSGDMINNYERGRVIPSERIISHCCLIYGINQEWLRTGIGDMFVYNVEDTPNGILPDTIGKLAIVYENDSNIRAMLDAFAGLNVDQQKAIGILAAPLITKYLKQIENPSE